MDAGLTRPSLPPAPFETSPPLELHFTDDDEEVIDSSPPTPRFDTAKQGEINGAVTQRRSGRPTTNTEHRSITTSTSPSLDLMTLQGHRTSESDCQTQSDGVPDPSFASPLDDNFMSLPRRSNGHVNQQNDPHIAAILRDAQPPKEALRSPVRSQSPTRPRLTHYSSADEILQRFSEKWKKYQEMTGDHGESEKASSVASHEEEMPVRRRAAAATSSKQQKRPTELDLLRQENGQLKKKLNENEAYFNEKVDSLTSALEEGKRLWERTNKDNVDLRSRAEVDSLKMQRMEDRIRTLESALQQSPSNDEAGFWNEASLRRVVDMQEQELSVLRKELELYQNRHKASYSSGTDHDGTSNSRVVPEEKPPKQYRSTGDLRVPPTSSVLRPSSVVIGKEIPLSNSLPRPASVGRGRGSAHDPSKIYWIDDVAVEEPPRTTPQQPEFSFEPPKVHPMIVKMATKRKRQERSKTLGYGELHRSRSNDRDDDRTKPVWIQRVLNKRRSPAEGQTVIEKPPAGPDRPPSRQEDQRRVNVYCLGRRVQEAERGSPEPEYRPPSREGRKDKEEERPPTSVLIESIRQRVREFNLSAGGSGEAERDHGPADGRRSAEMERKREESPHRIARPASSMELGHHVGSREYRNPLIDDSRLENEENEEDAALKHRVHNILDRRQRNSGEQQMLRPPVHGPVRALHSWTNNGDDEEQWDDGKPQVPPLDLSKLKPEKIAQGTGLPTDMRNYADELIKKYMSSLAAANAN